MAKKNCTKGHACGATCISGSKVCKKGFTKEVSVSIDGSQKVILTEKQRKGLAEADAKNKELDKKVASMMRAEEKRQRALKNEDDIDNEIKVQKQKKLTEQKLKRDLKARLKTLDRTFLRAGSTQAQMDAYEKGKETLQKRYETELKKVKDSKDGTYKPKM